MNPPSGQTKVLMIIPFLHQGGAQRQVTYLFEKIDKSRFEMHLGYFINHDVFYKDLLKHSASHLVFGKGDKITPRSWFSLIRKVRRLKPDIIHAYVQPADFLGGFAHYFFSRIPLIFSVGMSKQPAYRYRLYRFLRNRPSLTFCNSVRIREELVRMSGFPEEKIVVVSNPLDTEKFSPFDKAGKERARAALGQDPRGLILASIGRISPQKNQLGTVRALQRLREAGGLPADFKFIFIGNRQYPNYEKEVRDLIARFGLERICELRDPTEDIVSFYNAVDGVFQPSHHEGLSNAVIECQSSGTPVALSKEGDNDGLVIEGETGISFSMESDEQTTLGLRRLIDLCSDPRRREAVVRRAREAVQRRFSVSRTVQVWQENYERILQSRKRVAG